MLQLFLTVIQRFSEVLTLLQLFKTLLSLVLRGLKLNSLSF